MESKKINQLATNVNPQTSDLTTIGDPVTGQLKKITWLQVAHLIGAQASLTLQDVTNQGATTTLPITTGGLTLSNLNNGVLKVAGGVVSTYPYGQANGVASLDSGGKVPASQLPSSIMDYKGTWNAATNTPTLVNGTGDTGDVYRCNVAGTVNFGAGNITFKVGDWAIYNGTIWEQSNNSDAVSSVFGRTGDITAQEGDYNIGQLGDVTITSAATNDYLRYNGTGWVNTQFPTFVSSDKLVLQVRNNSGATINKGTVVYINGATAGYPTIAKAQADADNTSAQTLGLVQDNISNNSNGVVVIVGQITGIDTSAYPAGTQLYLSGTTAGAFTSTKTLAPTHLVYVGIVTTQNAVNGVIEVKIQNGYELDEIHDVAISSVANNQGLFYESSTSLWKNKSIATVLGYTPEQPLTFSAPLSRSTNTVSIPAATGSVNGYLTSTDWTTFNNKITNPMTTLGDIIFGGTSGNPNRLAGNTTTTKQYLSQTGTGTDSASPTWATISGSDITGAALTKTDDTNVTLTLGGTPATALLRAASLTLGWTGQLSVARGGTGLSALGTAGQLLRVNTGATALEYFTPTYISAAITSLNGLTAATQTFSNDTNVTITSATATHTIGWSGELSIARGGTGASTKAAAFNALSPMTTLGDIIYGGASGTGTRLAGSTSASKRFLTQTGDGTNSAAPSWGSIAAGDVPILNQNTTGSAATLTTARTFTIGATGKTFDGSANVSWSASEIGLTNYLPLAGGTMTGQIVLANVTDSTDYTKGLRFPNDPFGGSGDISGLRLYRNGASGEKMTLELYIGNDSDDTINFATGVGGTANNNGVTINGNVVYNAGNIPTWNQNTTGSAATLTTARTFTIGATGKTFDGSANVSWSLAEIGAQAALTNPVTGTGSASRLAYWDGNNSITSTSLLNVDTTNAALVINATAIAGYSGIKPKLEVYGSNMTSADPDGGNIVIYGTANTGNSGSSIALGSSYGTGYGTFARVRGVKANSTAGDTGGGIAFDVRPSNTGFQQALFINSVGAASFASSVSANGIITANNSGAAGSILQSVMSYADGYRATLRLNNTHTGGKNWEVYSTNTSDGVYGGGKFAIRNVTDDIYVLNISSSGTATFSSQVADYGLTVTNVQDSSQGLLVRSSDNDTTLYLARFQSSVGATSQTWVDRFSIAKNGSTVIGDNIPAVNVRLWVKGSDQTASNYAMDVTDSLGQSIAWFRNDKAVRFFGNVELTTTTFAQLKISNAATTGANRGTSFEVNSTTNAGTTFLGQLNAISNNANAPYNSTDAIYLMSRTSGIPLIFTTNNGGTEGERMRITSGGLVGIGLPGNGTGTGMEFATSGATPRINWLVSSVYILEVNATSSQGYIKTNANLPLLFGTNDIPRMTITSGGAVQATNNLTANSPSAGNTGEGIIAGTSFKIDAGGTGQKAKMYVVSKDLSDTYGSGLQIQFANQADDKGFGFNLNTSGGYETYTKHTNGSWKRRYVINQNGAFVLRDIDETGGRRFFAYEGGTGNANGFGLDMAGNSYEASIFFAYGVSDSGRLTFGSHDGTTYRTKMTIHGNGNIGAPSGSNIYNASDLRLKQNINTIDNGLSKVLALNPVKFNWINNYISEENDKDMLGFIAQEVAKIIPEAVEGFADGQSIKVGDKIINSPLRVNEKFIIPVIVKAIQELNAKLEAK